MLAATAHKGDAELRLQHAVNWEAGDRIVIASTGGRHSQRENEEFTVTKVSTNTSVTESGCV